MKMNKELIEMIMEMVEKNGVIADEPQKIYS